MPESLDVVCNTFIRILAINPILELYQKMFLAFSYFGIFRPLTYHSKVHKTLMLFFWHVMVKMQFYFMVSPRKTHNNDGYMYEKIPLSLGSSVIWLLTIY